MTAISWIASAVLGAGSVTVFVLFLRDFRRVLPPPPSPQRVEKPLPTGEEVAFRVD